MIYSDVPRTSRWHCLFLKNRAIPDRLAASGDCLLSLLWAPAALQTLVNDCLLDCLDIDVVAEADVAVSANHSHADQGEVGLDTVRLLSFCSK